MLALIVEGAIQLFRCDSTMIYRHDEARGGLTVFRGRPADPSRADEWRARWARLFIRPGEGIAGRVFQERRPLWSPNLGKDTIAQYADEQTQNSMRESTIATLGAPIIIRGDVYGVLSVFFLSPRDFTPQEVRLIQALADHAAIALENARLYAESEAHARDLAEALEQQTATSEILRVISSSPTDIQPVLDTVAESAARLCEAFDASVYRRDGDRLLLVAHQGPIPVGPVGEFTLPVRGTAAGRSVLDARTVHVADVQTEADEFPESNAQARRTGFHTVLIVPLMREGLAIGAISLRRTEVQLFTERQVALLTTFAAQAVIAIENVRLFEELEARNRDLMVALDRQTATSEILRVIAGSQTDVQPVFDAIVLSAVRLCRGFFGAVFRYDGEVVSLAAQHNLPPEGLEAMRRTYPRPLAPDIMAGRALLSRAVVHIHDAASDTESPTTAAVARAAGFRTSISVPMMREGQAVGTINVSRREMQPFSDTEIALLKTFADQAVIAVENVRLFTELEARNRDVTEALEQQTATAEILRVISRSPTDFQPVFDTIVRNAATVCGANDAVLLLADGDDLVWSAHHGPIQFKVGDRFPMRGSVSGRAVSEARVVHVENLAEADEFPAARERARQGGFRTTLSVPLLREGAAIGAIMIRRSEVRAFTPNQIELLQTFADQAVIAIENARLFRELEARNKDLTVALE